MPTITVTPKAGLKVRDPETGQHLPTGGANKRQNAYWLRAARRGDVTISQVKTAAKKKAAKKADQVEETTSAVKSAAKK